jgi:hypothetical protein
MRKKAKNETYEQALVCLRNAQLLPATIGEAEYKKSSTKIFANFFFDCLKYALNKAEKLPGSDSLT